MVVLLCYLCVAKFLLELINQIEMENVMMTYKEASEFLHLSVNTLRNYVCRKVIPHYRGMTGRVYFDQSELSQWQRHKKVIMNDVIEGMAQTDVLDINK